MQTEAEILLWFYLRNRKLKGLKFRRQHSLGNYVVDFFCPERNLVIELDGSVHNNKKQKEYDNIRQEILTSWGYKIIRFKNREVMFNIKEVLKKIEITPYPDPLFSADKSKSQGLQKES